MKNTTHTIIATSIIAYIAIWSWVNREHIIPKEYNSFVTLVSATEMIKNSPFPEEPFTPIGTAYESFIVTPKWESYTSPKGTKVVEFSGNLKNNEIRDDFLNDSWDKKFACKNLTIVKNFISSHGRQYVDYDSFHKAVVSPSPFDDIVNLDGYQEASKEYATAKELHFNSKVRIRTQFLIHIQTSNKSLKQQFTRSDFSIGFSGYKISDGLFSKEEIQNDQIPELIREK